MPEQCSHLIFIPMQHIVSQCFQFLVGCCPHKCSSNLWSSQWSSEGAKTFFSSISTAIFLFPVDSWHFFFWKKMPTCENVQIWAIVRIFVGISMQIWICLCANFSPSPLCFYQVSRYRPLLKIEPRGLCTSLEFSRDPKNSIYPVPLLYLPCWSQKNRGMGERIHFRWFADLVDFRILIQCPRPLYYTPSLREKKYHGEGAAEEKFGLFSVSQLPLVRPTP